MGKTNAIIPRERIVNLILQLRGQNVMIDSDVAALYGVKTKVLNQAVKRNIDRFPSDFMFQLTKEEKKQVVTSCDHLESLKFSPVLPYAFTEHGSVMAASVLNSERAVAVSIYVVRAFMKLRQMLAGQKDLAGRLDEIEKKLQSHNRQIAALVRQLMPPPDVGSKQPFGFHPKKAKEKKPSSKKSTK